MTPEDPTPPAGEPRLDQVRARQRGRAVVMALALAAFAVLMYFITIARMSGN